MINHLTKAQKAKFSAYRDKWLAIGLETKPADREEAEKGIREVYAVAGLKSPKVVWCLSPLSSGLTRFFVFEILKAKNIDVWASVRASVRDSVRASVRASVRDSVRASVRASVGDSGYGQHDVAWLGFYDYFKNELKLETQTEKLNGLWILARNANWFIPHRNICWISERHDICKLKEGRIHSGSGPAIHYPDGFSIWALNGVRVPQWLVETGANRIDPKKFMEIDNAEVRREFVRKVGMEMIVQRCGAITLSKKGDYELLRFKVSESEEWTYLKMRNPSIGVWHVEGVPNEIKTVDEALRWREPKELQGITRSENGRDYYQQGDVVIWPREARVLKPQPTIVT